MRKLSEIKQELKILEEKEMELRKEEDKIETLEFRQKLNEMNGKYYIKEDNRYSCGVRRFIKVIGIDEKESVADVIVLSTYHGKSDGIQKQTMSYWDMKRYKEITEKQFKEKSKLFKDMINQII